MLGVHRFTLISRAGNSKWTPEALGSWIEVLTGHQVSVQDQTRSSWFGVSKVMTFEVSFEGDLQQASAFLKVLQQHFKVEPAR
ncbi:hypothetical protein GCM10008938_12320 [Deinococcus roseus]|uniref:Uncharacterized protein n=2 Tax=Deinococcus roseus TaxID=392414 RepID=A0ABQ2CWG4_9DEIO|nr:hypothetical protein GCM10008938_12320 [Deinococcus roseus]